MTTTDRYLWTRDHSITAEVIFHVENRAIPPAMDELGKHFGDVRTRRLYPAPETGSTTAPDWNFVASVILTLTAAGGVEFLRRIIGHLADDAYEGLRRELLRTRRRQWTLRRVKRRVVLRIGHHHFVFDQSITDAEFRRQLSAAQALVDRSPDWLLQTDDLNDEWRPWLWVNGRWRTAGVRVAQAVGEELRTLD